MKNLLTLVAAIAITSVASAQTATNTCTVTSLCGVKTYTTTSFVTANHSRGVVTVKDFKTGEVLDTFDCDKGLSSSVQVNCKATASSSPEIPTTTGPDTETSSIDDIITFLRGR